MNQNIGNQPAWFLIQRNCGIPEGNIPAGAPIDRMLADVGRVWRERSAMPSMAAMASL
jgi:hypothetical protein